jgi:hypothetical protein
MVTLQWNGAVMTPVLPRLGRFAALATVCAGMTGALMPAAQARVFVGIGVPWFGPPGFYYPPPVYYPPPPVYYPPPPVVYTPPPVVYTPPPYQAAPAGIGRQTCYAPSYTCPMDNPVPVGATCYCLDNHGQRVYGRAN